MLDELITQLPSNVSVELPPEVFEGIDESKAEAGIIFTFYKTSTLFPAAEGSENEGFVVGTPVVGVSIADTNITNLSSPVIITLPLTEMVSQWFGRFIRSVYTVCAIFSNAMVAFGLFRNMPLVTLLSVCHGNSMSQKMDVVTGPRLAVISPTLMKKRNSLLASVTI